MTDIKKDHNIGAGTGAAGGAVTGAVIGSAVAGPVGTVIGAVAGGIAGAKAGDSIAEMVNPTEYNQHFESSFRDAPGYVQGREWSDYQPAYQYGYQTYGQNRGKQFEDVEGELERNWDSTRADSRLQWNEARSAVRDSWHHIERKIPGDADGDGR